MKNESKKKPTIAEQVTAATYELMLLETPKDLRDWAIKKGFDNRSAFPKFKEALLKIGINYDGMKAEKKQEKAEALEAAITHKVVLYSDAKASKDRYGICDEDGNVLWHGRFFESDDYNGEQSSGELCAAKKAVWLASKIKEAVNAPAIELTLYIDAQWLTYQDHAGQKGYALTILAEKHNIKLKVEWISGKRNPADEWTVASGFKKWSDNNLAALAHAI